MSRTEVSRLALSEDDLRVDRELADIATSFRFLLDVTPAGLLAARTTFRETGRTPSFEYRPLGVDPETVMARLDAVPISGVEEPTVASLLQAKQRELVLLVQMLACRGSEEFLSLSIEQFGAVSPALLREADGILCSIPPTGPEVGPWLDAEEFVSLARSELDRYRANAPAIECRVEVRTGSTGVMVSNGDLFVAPTARVSAHRAEALIHHEVGTHVLTYVNGSHQPLRTLASGLAGHEETQEGLAVLAEYLVGGLTANRLRQLAARVVAVHQMVGGAEFPEVHRWLVDTGVPVDQAFTITTRVFRSGGLTKDAVYLRGLHGLLDHLRAGQPLDPLWLGKMPLSAVPLIEDLHRRGVLADPVLTPRYLGQPNAGERLALAAQVDSLASLVGGTE